MSQLTHLSCWYRSHRKLNKACVQSSYLGYGVFLRVALLVFNGKRGEKTRRYETEKTGTTTRAPHASVSGRSVALTAILSHYSWVPNVVSSMVLWSMYGNLWKRPSQFCSYHKKYDDTWSTLPILLSLQVSCRIVLTVLTIWVNIIRQSNSLHKMTIPVSYSYGYAYNRF